MHVTLLHFALVIVYVVLKKTYDSMGYIIAHPYDIGILL